MDNNNLNTQTTSPKKAAAPKRTAANSNSMAKKLDTATKTLETATSKLNEAIEKLSKVAQTTVVTDKVEVNPLKQPTKGALTKNMDYRDAIKAPDLFAVGNQDPKRAYRWLNFHILTKNGGFDARGWEVINDKTSHGEFLESSWGTHTSGTEMRVGDNILAYMPIERMEMKRAMLAEANKKLTRSETDNLRNVAARSGAIVTGNVESQIDGITEKF